jgi:hypothetical protein
MDSGVLQQCPASEWLSAGFPDVCVAGFGGAMHGRTPAFLKHGVIHRGASFFIR